MAKPNGLELSVIVISIDDGYAEWSYHIKPRKSYSIDDICRRICRALKAKKTKGRIRTTYECENGVYTKHHRADYLTPNPPQKPSLSQGRKVEIMKNNEVVAKIYCLAASILLGKTTEEEIKEVCRLAKEHDCFDVFRDEIKDCDRIIRQL